MESKLNLYGHQLDKFIESLMAIDGCVKTIQELVDLTEVGCVRVDTKKAVTLDNHTETFQRLLLSINQHFRCIYEEVYRDTNMKLAKEIKATL